MSAHVLLNLLHKLRKRDKRRGLQSILYLFRNKLNKFKNRGAQMLDSIYRMTFKLIKYHIFGMKMLSTQHYNGCHYVTLQNLLTT